MKSRKASGADGVLAEYFKLGETGISMILGEAFTNYHREGKIPKDWTHAKIVLPHKKGSKEDLKNHCPISLLPIIYKTLRRIIGECLKTALSAMQLREQAGFLRGFSVMDHNHRVPEIINRTNAYEIPLVLCFVDYAQ